MFFKKGKIEKTTNILYLGILTTIITIIINLIAYKFLPENIALQTNGGNQISKLIFLFIIPSITIIVNFMNIKLNNRGKFNAIAINFLLIIVDLFVIIMNLK